jgi:DUF917 family protein
LRLDASNLPAFARGCAVLAAGASGDPELGLVIALRAVEEHGPIEVIDPADLDDGALVMPCGAIGAPTIADERIWNGDEGGVLRDAVERLHGSTVRALMCFEIGGANGLLPVGWAARLGLPLVDADGKGRTFPGLHQQAMHLAGVPAGPMAMTDGRGNTLVLRAVDEGWAERLARGVAASLGGVCAGALYCMPAERARTATVAGSPARAVAIGQAVAGTREARRRPIAIADALGAAMLIEGRLVDVERRAGHGFVQGAATVQGAGRDAGRQLRLELQNEYLLALEDGEVRAAVPDLICVLAGDTGDPIATEGLRYGQNVAVIAARAPDIWLTGDALALVGPGAFGYEVEYASV